MAAEIVNAVRHKVFWAFLVIGLIALQVPPIATQTTLAREPLSSLKITVRAADFDSFMEKIASIAEHSGFAFRSDQMGSEKRSVLIQLWRIDVFVIINNNFSELDEYHLFLYNTDNTSPISKDVIQKVVDSFKAELTKGTGIRVTDIPLKRY